MGAPAVAEGYGWEYLPRPEGYGGVPGHTSPSKDRRQAPGLGDEEGLFTQ
ncbi:hypothetical protein [Streptomyces sp. AM8-1-1]|nr:hypothetical protein [Streptomyces sp. AM8-1-1]WNO74705.1 hypothetical protein RPQ07_25245 [Streptomyces sp. AM8-1-1]